MLLCSRFSHLVLLSTTHLFSHIRLSEFPQNISYTLRSAYFRVILFTFTKMLLSPFSHDQIQHIFHNTAQILSVLGSIPGFINHNLHNILFLSLSKPLITRYYIQRYRYKYRYRYRSYKSSSPTRQYSPLCALPFINFSFV